MQIGLALSLLHPAACSPSTDPDLRRQIASLRANLDAWTPAAYRNLSDTTLVDICRGDLNEALGEKLGHQARMVPAMRHGAPIGFKVYAVRPGSVLALLGIRNGDTLRLVNGVALADADGALAAYSQLKSASSLEIQLERRGVPRRIVVLIHDGCVTPRDLP